mmetsp:Transcript_2792/g.8495  ORF Transcript_2792/g.8495 Transcript_2792/m.8495 type:complete len:236 (+) Transcript_2792:646-1353(+)
MGCDRPDAISRRHRLTRVSLLRARHNHLSTGGCGYLCLRTCSYGCLRVGRSHFHACGCSRLLTGGCTFLGTGGHGHLRVNERCLWLSRRSHLCFGHRHIRSSLSTGRSWTHECVSIGRGGRSGVEPGRLRGRDRSHCSACARGVGPGLGQRPRLDRLQAAGRPRRPCLCPGLGGPGRPGLLFEVPQLLAENVQLACLVAIRRVGALLLGGSSNNHRLDSLCNLQLLRSQAGLPRG